jgi:hypothetical protein
MLLYILYTVPLPYSTVSCHRTLYHYSFISFTLDGNFLRGFQLGAIANGAVMDKTVHASY